MSYQYKTIECDVLPIFYCKNLEHRGMDDWITSTFIMNAGMYRGQR